MAVEWTMSKLMLCDAYCLPVYGEAADTTPEWKHWTGYWQVLCSYEHPKYAVPDDRDDCEDKRMGFIAPSAEEVYRYALRLDDPKRFLTDRFGFSIVFVNDDSSACQEFLSRYFVDLCYSTAHRIRFVFFANLAALDVSRVAD